MRPPQQALDSLASSAAAKLAPASLATKPRL